MRFKAELTPYGAYIPIYFTSNEIEIGENTILFKIDTGAESTAISRFDLEGIGVSTNWDDLEEGDVWGIGGHQECRIIHNVDIFLLNEENMWYSIIKLHNIEVLPNVFDEETNEIIFNLPSLLGIDVIGKCCSLHYGENEVYLEYNEQKKS